MGVKDLWSILTPFADRKPICELRGKTVAIDLAGWVCESLNVVDYFVHPRHHLKNLFFRTCYLIWEDITPVFVLEGAAPKLKSQVIAKRNDMQFRGVKPKQKDVAPTQSQSINATQKEKGRTRFNHVLKQCEQLLRSMGIQCVQGPGEAEAYCAFLNKNGLVDGIISQDSDCFAYGALCVYRNFSVSTQGSQAAAGGAVDIYDMTKICAGMDFGQNKIIVMALLSGCDYCPEGIGGVGRDSVIKLFSKYKESEILTRLRMWRSDSHKYNALEMRVDDKTICTYCGHIGRTQCHTKRGCGICRTKQGCDESLWKDERLAIKAELLLRKKALADVNFPNEEVITEFLTDPPIVPDLDLHWQQPNLVKFIKQIGKLLQWPEIYCFQKFFPILTRWQVMHTKDNIGNNLVILKTIIKKRMVKGVPSLEVLWHDERGYFQGLIPDQQLEDYVIEHPKGVDELYCTIEPLNLLETAYPEIVLTYLKSKEKPKKVPRLKSKQQPLSALENLVPSTGAANNKKQTKRTKKVAAVPKGHQLIDKFFKQKENMNTPAKQISARQHCSTPIKTYSLSDLEDDDDSMNDLDMSDIINGIVTNPNVKQALKHVNGYSLHYESIEHDLSAKLAACCSLNKSSNVLTSDEIDHLKKQSKLDDADLLVGKHQLSITASSQNAAKRYSLDDSFDLMVKNVKKFTKHLEPSGTIQTPLDRFKQRNQIPTAKISDNLEKTPLLESHHQISFFFNQSLNCDEDNMKDAFEEIMNVTNMTNHNQKDLLISSDSV